MSTEETAQVVDIETTLKTMEGLINAVAETNDKRYQLLLQLIEDLKKKVDMLEKGSLSYRLRHWPRLQLKL